MKARINEINSYTKVCVLRGFYDEEGEYHEEHMEDFPLCELPKETITMVDFDYDITTLYSKYDVLVVAKSMQDIDEYRKLGAKPHFFHGLLHIAELDRYDGYMSIVADLEALKSGPECNKKRNNNSKNTKSY